MNMKLVHIHILDFITITQNLVKIQRFRVFIFIIPFLIDYISTTMLLFNHIQLKHYHFTSNYPLRVVDAGHLNIL